MSGFELLDHLAAELKTREGILFREIKDLQVRLEEVRSMRIDLECRIDQQRDHDAKKAAA